MIKIINGRRYDTAKATLIGEYWNGLSKSNFNYVEEKLYRKRGGEFFIHGEGGPKTLYCRTVGLHERTSGEKIVPLPYEEARRWGEDHLSVEDYDKIFPSIDDDDEEADNKTLVGVYLPAAVKEKLKRLASEHQMSQSDVVADLIKNS